MPRPPFNARSFFAKNKLFRHDEFVAAFDGTPRAATEALRRFVEAGTLISVRRGVYAVNDDRATDPWLLPSKLNPRAVLAYDGAASFHRITGLVHSLTYLVPSAAPPFVFGEVVYRALGDPSVRTASRDRMIHAYPRNGHPIAVTSHARTIADCFDRPELAPPLEEVYWGVLSKKGIKLDVDSLVHYTLRRCSSLAAARVGVLLEALPHLRVTGETLRALEKRAPRETHYGTTDREPGGVYFARWKLVMPRDLAGDLMP